MTESIFDISVNCSKKILRKLNENCITAEISKNDELGMADYVFTSPNYRRAHVSVIDARETTKLWFLHFTIFPNIDDASPIYGFDIVVGPTRVSGAFHDFSQCGDSDNFMMKWFSERTTDLPWNKRRELPDWANSIFSPNIVAIGAVSADELQEFIKLGLETLDYYITNLNKTQNPQSDFRELQNRYCHYQKQNPHTPVILVKMGLSKEAAADYIDSMLFPENP